MPSVNSSEKITMIERFATERIVAKSGIFDAHWYLRQNPDVCRSGASPLEHYVRFGEAEGRKPSPLFDPRFYAGQVRGLSLRRSSALCHYVMVGEREGKRPNPWFDPKYVEAHTRGVRNVSSILGAYLLMGASLVPPGRDFDPSAYLAKHPMLLSVGTNPLQHYLDSPLTSYLQLASGRLRSNDSYDLAVTIDDGLKSLGFTKEFTYWHTSAPHLGFYVERADRRIFSPAHYQVEIHLEVDSRIDRLDLRSDCADNSNEEWVFPLLRQRRGSNIFRGQIALPDPTHSLRVALRNDELAPSVFGLGRIEVRLQSRIAFYGSTLLRRRPTAEGFSSSLLAIASDAIGGNFRQAAARMRQGFEPLREKANLAPSTNAQLQGFDSADPSLLPAPLPRLIEREARWHVERILEFTREDDVLIFAAYSPRGSLSQLQSDMIKAYRASGYVVFVVVNTHRMDEFVDPGCAQEVALIIRENIGWDFGAWRDACRLIAGLENARSVTFTNDSVVPVGGAAGALSLKVRVNTVPESVVFCTRNLEVRPHLQSYFFAFKRPSLEAGALELLRCLPLYQDKDDLIHNEEINLSSRIEALGLQVSCLFQVSPAEAAIKNPTIHYWQELLDQGYPFFKLQLLTSGLLTPLDPRYIDCLAAELRQMIDAHLTERLSPPVAPLRQLSIAPVSSFENGNRFNDWGAQNAQNLGPGLVRPIAIPFEDIGDASFSVPAVLGIVHCFYLDVAAEILSELSTLQIDLRLILTTDTTEKQRELQAMVSERQLNAKVVVAPNRGRDVAPFLSELSLDAGDEQIIFHLHTKKSKHDDRYADWGSFLRQNLIGDRDHVLSIIALLHQPECGLVYSEHFREVAGLRNWGYDFDAARVLIERMGGAISADTPLEFPTSTMFWAKRAALAPLLSLKLGFQDFEPEQGQIDGTLAHSIERSLLFVCELAGYKFLKVISKQADPAYQQDAIEVSSKDVPRLLKKLSVRLLGNGSPRSVLGRHVGEIYPVDFCQSGNLRPRINLVIPTMKPEKIYGGISTAISSFHNLLQHLPETDIRVLVVSDDVDRPSAKELAVRLGRPCVASRPGDDPSGGTTLVDVFSNRGEPLSLRKNDVMFATAWWTADLSFRAIDFQRAAFGSSKPLVYLIQDFEPGFYNWSDHYALAESTYWRADETIALINSEELFDFMQARYAFKKAMVVPFALNERLKSLVQPRAKEKLILCYARPGTARNCFHVLVEGICRWQAMRPDLARKFRVVFAGEPFDASLVDGVENAEVSGKLSLDDYADLLNRAAIGVSLMVSPHPSYPPLEMAGAGAWTITNNYENKVLARRSPNIISLSSLNPQALALALNDIAVRVEQGQFGAVQPIGALATVGELVDMVKVADWISASG